MKLTQQIHVLNEKASRMDYYEQTITELEQQLTELEHKRESDDHEQANQ